MAIKHPTKKELIEWWEWQYEDSWERQLKEFGYVTFPEDWDDIDDGTRRICLVVESRWTRTRDSSTTPSKLWDASLPQTVFAGW